MEGKMSENIVLKMSNISKTFPGVKALSNVDFTLREGEIHALMGENGAGKSTLIKVLTGVHDFQTGEIYMVKNAGGKPELIVNHSPQEAQQNGISTVYQEVNLCPNLTVAENLFIGREPRRFGMIDWRTMNRKSTEVLKNLDIHVAPTQSLDECSLAIQQMIAIARAVDMKCRVLILDEPTSSLDDDEVQKLFVLMRKLRAEGVGIIFVTHFLEQVYEVCDRITVLRNGELVGEYEVESLPRVKLVSKMMGKDFDDLAAVKTFNPKLGIIGGISIIGTSGIVRPFSSDAFIASIRKEASVAKAIGCETLVINSGAKSERYLRSLYAPLPPQSFVHYGNFIGETLKIAADLGFKQVILGIMIGKAVKLAEGFLDTHSKKVVMNKGFLQDVAKEAKCEEATVDAINRITLARELWELLTEKDQNRFFPLLLQKCKSYCAPILPDGELTLLLISEEGKVLYQS